ncbi:PAS domain-containing protein [Streptomyces sp. NPDC055157]
MAFETAGAAIALLDSKGTVVGWSQAARRLVGYWAAEGVGSAAASCWWPLTTKRKLRKLRCRAHCGAAGQTMPKSATATVTASMCACASQHCPGRTPEPGGWSGPPTRLHSPAGARGHGSGVAPGQAAAAEPPADRHRHTRHATALHLGERHPGLQGRHPPSPVVGPQADGGRIRAEAETWADQRLYGYL